MEALPGRCRAPSAEVALPRGEALLRLPSAAALGVVCVFGSVLVFLEVLEFKGPVSAPLGCGELLVPGPAVTIQQTLPLL